MLQSTRLQRVGHTWGTEQQRYSAVWMDCVLFICPPTDRPLGRVHLPLIVSKAAAGVRSVCADVLSSLLGRELAVELLGHMGFLGLTEELPDCFPKRPHHFPSPPATYEPPVSPRPCQHLLLPVTLISSILLVPHWF